MTYFTIKRMRFLGKIVGVSCILVGLIALFLVPATGWQFQHLYTYASFLTLLGIGFLTIIFTRSRDVAKVVEEAAMAGYVASESEKRRLEDGSRKAQKLYLLLPLAYTIVWLFAMYFIIEPMGTLAFGGAYSLYFMLTWLVPIFVIVFFAIPYYIARMYPEEIVLLRKSGEGAALQRRMRELGVEKPGDLRILNEGEQKEKKRED